MDTQCLKVILHLWIYQAVDISRAYTKGDEIIQILSARPYFEHKSSESNVWVGSGMFCLRTADGNFTSEDHVLVAQITQLDGAVSFYACFEGNKVRIDEEIYNALSGAFCAGEPAPFDAFFHRSVEGYWIDMSHG